MTRIGGFGRASAVAALIAASSGCGSTSSTATTPQTRSSSDSASAPGGQQSQQRSPEGLCKRIPAADVATGLGIPASDVQSCDVEGGDPSPAAGARLLASGKYQFYTLFLTPDEDQSIWSAASRGRKLYEIDGRPCFDSQNKPAKGSATVSVQCSNSPAKNVVSFQLFPLPNSSLPAGALDRAHAVAIVVFPKVFTYRRGD